MKILETYTDAQKQVFIDMVHSQWQEDFLKIEKTYAPRLYLGQESDQVVTGIAVFESKIPEKKTLLKKANQLLPPKTPYLGYFVVHQTCRGQGLGSAFLKSFLKLFSDTAFWGVIEDPGLQKFYEKNGFHVIGQMNHEIILATGT